MIEPWIICGGLGLIAGWFFGRSRRYKKKFKDLNGNYGKLKQDLTKALGEVGRSKLTIEFLRKSNAYFEERISEYMNLTTFGCRNLKIREHQSFSDPMVPIGIISVIGALEDKDYHFIIKDFEFDNFNAEDREFAIREAEELIETINKF